MSVAASPGDTRITVTWDPVAGASSYTVYQSPSPGVTTTSAPFSAPTSPQLQSGLMNGQIYYYRVAGINAAGLGMLSMEVNATPHALIPGAPTGVSAMSGNGQITIHWNPPTGEVPSVYNLYWSASPGVTVASPSPHLGVTSAYVDMGLTPGTSYYYRVSATTMANGEALSAEVNARTMNCTGGMLNGTWACIQDLVFTPMCVGCHSGGTQPDLRDPQSKLIVNMPSGEVPAVNYITPGDIANSYLLMKVRGDMGIMGNQMPPGGMLPAGTITDMETWVGTNNAVVP